MNGMSTGDFASLLADLFGEEDGRDTIDMFLEDTTGTDGVRVDSVHGEDHPDGYRTVVALNTGDVFAIAVTRVGPHPADLPSGAYTGPHAPDNA